ncbi:hypothetical protein HID58_029036 [Brassica napus]|uniref:Uncharacterized protein n=1 Tax=Brassica napus TaxID=3708 RepID=A0ABQ8CDX1_BRANA|nr:hypothetical protein HID58_029036 [Brassica napus]
MSSAQMDPHDKMRSRDLSKVARGQQAPRPTHAPGTVSPPPQNEATFQAKRGEDGGEETDSARDELFPVTKETRHCFNRYMQYHRCLEGKGRDANDCNSLRDYVQMGGTEKGWDTAIVNLKIRLQHVRVFVITRDVWFGRCVDRRQY